MSAIEEVREMANDGLPVLEFDYLFIERLLTEIEEIEQKVGLLCEDWSEDHSYLQDLCRKAGVPEDDVTGVSSEVLPGIQDLADMLYQKVAALEKQSKRTKKEALNCDEIDCIIDWAKDVAGPMARSPNHSEAMLGAQGLQWIEYVNTARRNQP